uniref:Uncharacterized protein n=1 Tax=Arion vulgaris TaxID=1028688 RepID=A0A0B6ZNJ5_9EUPU
MFERASQHQAAIGLANPIQANYQPTPMYCRKPTCSWCFNEDFVDIIMTLETTTPPKVSSKILGRLCSTLQNMLSVHQHCKTWSVHQH